MYMYMCLYTCTWNLHIITCTQTCSSFTFHSFLLPSPSLSIPASLSFPLPHAIHTDTHTDQCDNTVTYTVPNRETATLTKTVIGEYDIAKLMQLSGLVSTNNSTINDTNLKIKWANYHYKKLVGRVSSHIKAFKLHPLKDQRKLLIKLLKFNNSR